MMQESRSRRSFLTTAAAAAAAAAAWPILPARARASRSGLEVGEGVVDTTPPLGIEMAGFHRPVGEERRIAGIRGATAARALVLRCGDTHVALVSLDICSVSQEMTARVQQQVAQQVGVPAANVHLCATHTHSMPTFGFFRQWGAISPAYMASVEQGIVRAVAMAKADLAPASLCVGQSRVTEASNNRTTKTWKTDEQFAADSTDVDRWLDTTVHVLHFERGEGKPNLLWYHFSAHPVCYSDDQAGPDWPGLVAQLVLAQHKVTPSFLQGHCGDVNAGDTDHWIGTAENTANPVAAAISRSLDGARQVTIDQMRIRTEQVPLPLDLKLFAQWLDTYRQDPAQCASGLWVDAGFAEDWFRSASQRDMKQDQVSVPVTAMQLGDVGFVFHPAELYSYYGLAIRRDSPLPDTLVIGYTDDFAGYVPDPKAYADQEYSAIVVPKIVDWPPFAQTVGQKLTADALTMLKGIV